MIQEPFLKRKEYFMDINSKLIKNHISIRDSIQWTSSKGNIMSITDMDVNYIRNCVNKIERGEMELVRAEKLLNLKNELIYREVIKL
tara:strand:- start:59403 stop:59663 length:261 start_codon:yes stop_codon:yes gene_type:complete